MEASLGIAHFVVQVCLITSLIGVCHGQTVLVSVKGATAGSGESATLECRYSIDAAGYSLRNVRWLEGVDFASATEIAEFFGGVSDPTYFNDYDKQNVTATQTGSMSTLTLGVVTFDPANIATGSITYWCEAVYRMGFNEESDRKGVDLTVFHLFEEVPEAFDKTGNAITTEWSVTAKENVGIYLKVKDVFPETNFTWTIGENSLAENTVSNCEQHNISGLFNCTSEVTFQAEVAYDGKQLNCTVVFVPVQKEVELLITKLVVPVPTTPPPEPTQPPGTDGKPITVPTTPPEPTQPTGTDGKPTEATDQPLSVAAIAGISCGCVLAGLCLIGIGIYLCYTYDCCIWCGEHCPWCREHCSCCRKPPKDGGNRDENIGMNNTGDSEEDHPTEKDQDHITKKDLT